MEVRRGTGEMKCGDDVRCGDEMRSDEDCGDDVIVGGI